MSERSGIIKQILKILRKEYLTLTGINSFGTLKTLLNVFRNYIPKKKLNLTSATSIDDRQHKKYLKGRCKLTIFFYKNSQKKTDHDKVLEESSECTKEILEAKKNYILKMTKKLADSNTPPKSYWTIPDCFLYNKKSQQYHLYLSMVSLFQTFVKKQTFLITFSLLYAHL